MKKICKLEKITQTSTCKIILQKICKNMHEYAKKICSKRQNVHESCNLNGIFCICMSPRNFADVPSSPG